MKATSVVSAIVFTFLNSLLCAQEAVYEVQGSITIVHFQQQIKQEVGDTRGERLVEETLLGFTGSARYRITDWFGAGVFLRYDMGTRKAGRFAGFDAEGKTITEDKLGGSFSEFWAGPLVAFSWKQLIGEFGYAVIGTRSDDGRSDIASTTGDTTSSFSLKPGIAWIAAIGGNIPVVDDLGVLVKLEYRLRYYEKRGGEPLQNTIHHGTQDIAPFIGVSYRF